MLASFGETRTSVQRNHALLTPESFERILNPEWANAELVYLITPQMGARLSMALIEASGEGQAPANPGIARFAFVISGELALQGPEGEKRLGAEDYAFLPASSEVSIRYGRGARVALTEWKPVPGGDATSREIVGHAAERAGVPLRGDDRLMVQKLLPAGADFDIEFNLMSFEPGASLPYVESHFMEHGLLFLDGGGVYRLDDQWYPVKAGDAIWMGPHVPQWFGALGRARSRYLICKNYNRSPWAG